MNVQIEFYGIPRRRAGTGSVLLETGNAGICLGDVLLQLAQQYPKLADDCFDGQQLQASITANLNGNRFVTDADTQLNPGDSLLIMSADAGG